MEHAAIHQWLRRQAAAEAAGSFLFASFCFAGGAVVLVITFFFTYAIVWFGFNSGVSGFSELFFGQRLRLPHEGILAVSALFVGLLFWGNARISREYLGTLPRRNYPGPGLGRIGLPGALVSLLAYPGASAKMTTDLLFTGPRLVMVALSNAKKARRLMRLDKAECSRVLAALLSQCSRVSFAELSLQAGVNDPLKVFPQLRDIDGVVFLVSEPPGLSLTSELRAELCRAVGRVPDGALEESDAPAAIPPARLIDLHALLGTDQSATLEEIEAAYRKRLREVRAQRISGVDEELRKLVAEQLRAINAAYEAFLEKQKANDTSEKGVENVWERYRRS
jgi:hypothetical protein